jgi:uncharacterized membrane protein YraQ (UPF0718 family)
MSRNRDKDMTDFLLGTMNSSWHLLLESSIYILFGLIVSGILTVFISPRSISKHMGDGRFLSVFKAAIIGIPLPLCSCGVLPAAVSLKKQGANNGATTAFLISTPESGVDSISITYALLDPIMTIARPVSAFLTATAAGILENIRPSKNQELPAKIDLSCPVDGCCDGIDCPPEIHKNHHSFLKKLTSGFRFAFTSIWNDIAGWFFIGLLLAGIINALVPDDFLKIYFGGGVHSMLLMLLMGIPIYICATASTPVAAALIMKGVSPGAALVFLLAGPATNITSLTVLTGILGKRATMIYLAAISFFAVLFGLLVDKVYHALGIPPAAVIGETSKVIPLWMQFMGVAFILVISIKPIFRIIKRTLSKSINSHECHSPNEDSGEPLSCGGST